MKINTPEKKHLEISTKYHYIRYYDNDKIIFETNFYQTKKPNYPPTGVYVIDLIAFNRIAFGTERFGFKRYEKDNCLDYFINIKDEDYIQLLELIKIGTHTFVYESSINEIMYAGWKIFHKHFNEKPCWPKSEFPEATMHYIQNCGCFIFALCIALRHHNVITEDDENKFNPLIFHETIKKANLYKENGDFEYSKINKVFPIEPIGAFDYSPQRLHKAFNDDNICIVQVPGIFAKYHYVVIDRAFENDFLIIDSAGYNNLLSQYKKAYMILLFKKNNVKLY